VKLEFPQHIFESSQKRNTIKSAQWSRIFEAEGQTDAKLRKAPTKGVAIFCVRSGEGLLNECSPTAGQSRSSSWSRIHRKRRIYKKSE
jgi:hypothetical protein